MAIMSWDVEAMRNNAITPLMKSSNSLHQASNIISSISVPGDFEGTGELTSVIACINGLIGDIDGIRQRILAIALKFENAENRNKEILDYIMNSLFIQQMEDVSNMRKELEMLKLRTPEGVLAMAEKLKEQQTDWIYTSEHSTLHGGDGGLVYDDIEKSLTNPKKATCCATYVAQALYLAGYFTEDQMNGKDKNYKKDFGYNYQVHLQQLLKYHKWQKITEESELQAGDVVFTGKSKYEGPEHVQIYAGDYEWYNAGNTEDIQTLGKNVKKNVEGEELRTMKDILKYEGRQYWVAYRPPNLNTTEVSEADIFRKYNFKNGDNIGKTINENLEESNKGNENK